MLNVTTQFNFSFTIGIGVNAHLYNFSILAKSEREAKEIVRADLAKVIHEINESLEPVKVGS